MVDFGLRRTHGGEAGLKVARASYLSGFDATSDVLAGQMFGIPTAGTMAHSFVECFEDEQRAFEAFLASYPEGSTLLIDTYDTLEGARIAARVRARSPGCAAGRRPPRLRRPVRAEPWRPPRARRGGPRGRDDLRERQSRRARDRAPARWGAPIDGFGVGSRLGVSADAPFLDAAYKLVAFDGRPVMKLSTGKATLPGAKQVWRQGGSGRFEHDVVSLAAEPGPRGGVPLLEPVMEDGERIRADSLEEARSRAAAQRAALPPSLRRLDAGEYPVEIGTGLDPIRRATTAEAGR